MPQILPYLKCEYEIYKGTKARLRNCYCGPPEGINCSLLAGKKVQIKKLPGVLQGTAEL